MAAFIPCVPLRGHPWTDVTSDYHPSGLNSIRFAHSEHKPLAAIAVAGKQEQRVLVLGGTGRVGTETIKALARITPVPLSVCVAGRDAARGRNICRNLAALAQDRGADSSPMKYEFAKIDINNERSLADLISGHDMVIHTAGPFQRKESSNRVLQVAMAANVPYMDVCDDLTHAKECKKLHDAAQKKGYAALISTGIYPGLSNLMAAEASARLGNEKVDSLKIYYHTAGTGGIGATVLASTFLILSEDAICYDKLGREKRKPSAGDPEIVDFGGKLGHISTYLLNLPEVVSLHDNLFKDGPGTEIFAKFSTGPPVWNWLLQAMAKWIPKEWLANRSAMLAFSQFSLPVVKAVDVLSGARTAIKVVAEQPGCSVTYSYEHESLASCVGEATASFAFQLLKRNRDVSNSTIGSGVFYPEELGDDVRAEILKDAAFSSNLFRITTNVAQGSIPIMNDDKCK